MASFIELKDEIFAVIIEAENQLNVFFDNRKNSIALQIAIEKIQQITGILNLINNKAASLLATEILNQLINIPTGIGSNKDTLLSSIVEALYTLHRYLEHFGSRQVLLPELVLPAINKMRTSNHQPEVDASIFFTINITNRPKAVAPKLDATKHSKLVRQMHHMFQVGLLGIIKNTNIAASIKLMKRAISALDKLLVNIPSSNMLWFSSVLLEVLQDDALSLTKERKGLLLKIRTELSQVLKNTNHKVSDNLLKNMLYLIALGKTNGPLANELRKVIKLPDFKHNDKQLQQEHFKLVGPSLDALSSFSNALREELNEIQDSLDLIWRGQGTDDLFIKINTQIIKAIKILRVVAMDNAANTLNGLIPVINNWAKGGEQTTSDLNNIAEAIVAVETQIQNLGKGNLSNSATDNTSSLFVKNQFDAAQMLIVDEIILSLNTVQGLIEDYLNEHNGKHFLQEVSSTLGSVGGALLFIGRVNAAKIAIGASKLLNKILSNDITEIPLPVIEALIELCSRIEYYADRVHVLDTSSLQSILEAANANMHKLATEIKVMA